MEIKITLRLGANYLEAEIEGSQLEASLDQKQ
jgi:hypothetical protein